jgi:hypothetical protein
MTGVIAAFAGIVLVIALRYAGLATVIRQATVHARSASRAMNDPGMDDRDKERIVQRAAIGVLGAFVSTLVRAGVVLGLAGIPIGLGELSGVADAGETLAWLMRVDVIVIGSVVVILGTLVARRLGQAT